MGLHAQMDPIVVFHFSSPVSFKTFHHYNHHPSAHDQLYPTQKKKQSFLRLGTHTSLFGHPIKLQQLTPSPGTTLCLTKASCFYRHCRSSSSTYHDHTRCFSLVLKLKSGLSLVALPPFTPTGDFSGLFYRAYYQHSFLVSQASLGVAMLCIPRST